MPPSPVAQANVEVSNMKKFNWKSILSIAAIIAMIAFVVILILAILGPSIGNVFSDIVSGCIDCGMYSSYSTGPPAYDPGSYYGGTNPVNGEPYRDMFFESAGVNPSIDTEDDPLSTFALDVDSGSYTIMRAYLRDSNLPPKEAVRVEEYVNYFDMDYELPVGNTFALHLDGGPTPFMENDRYRVIRVGIQGYDIPDEARKPAVLTFVIDISGSMDMGNRLGSVKQSLISMVHALRPSDRVGIVVYGDTAWTVLEPTLIGERGDIVRAIESLQPAGSTYAEAGIRLGYQMAHRAFVPGAINRVILCSDGVANVGLTGYEDILSTIADYADKGITLTTVGFGMENYNDVLMERLADEGDGFYAYVDTPDEAERLFVDDLTGMLQFIAEEAKVQVAFNPVVVRSYRLLGYENRAIRDEDFRNDNVDAGELGAGHNVTALYEIKLYEGVSGEIAEVALRWREPDSGEVLEIANSIQVLDLAGGFEATSDSFQLAVLVAEFAEIMRKSYWAEESSFADLEVWIKGIDPAWLAKPEVEEFAQLVHRAVLIEGGGIAEVGNAEMGDGW